MGVFTISFFDHRAFSDITEIHKFLMKKQDIKRCPGLLRKAWSYY